MSLSAQILQMGGKVEIQKPGCKLHEYGSYFAWVDCDNCCHDPKSPKCLKNVFRILSENTK